MCIMETGRGDFCRGRFGVHAFHPSGEQLSGATSRLRTLDLNMADRVEDDGYLDTLIPAMVRKRWRNFSPR